MGDLLNNMKKLLTVFGILDALTLIQSYRIIIPLIRDLHYAPFFLGINLLIYISLILSSYFLIKQNKFGIWLTYGQFPLRLLYLTLSFGFLLLMNQFLQFEDLRYRIFIGFLVGLEILRLIITILIHRKYFRNTKSPVT